MRSGISFFRTTPRAAIGDGRALPFETTGGYRADIDGLRAMAVLPVVLNHAAVRGFGGGYVGVDIFFVISGFLITGILRRDLAAANHSIARFYRRRVLRIFPALFAMLVVTSLAAAIAMLPGELERYARSLVATALFVSNGLFYAESGYFDAASHIKPLLHTWSLAIEEQFYILWPLLLAAVGVARPGRLRLAVAAVTASSFIIALVTMARDPSAAFYLLPSRAWELGLGGMLALAERPIRLRALNEALGAIGIALILGAVWRFDQQTAFPGAAALLPCVGAALLIHTGDRGTVVARILSLAPAVFVGRISYSLYLWHWPVIVFAGIWLLLPEATSTGLACVAVSILLAWASWRLIELPFRAQGAGWRTPAVFKGALVAMLVALVAGTALLATNGLASRFTPAERAVAAYGDIDQEAAYRRGSCFITRYSETFDWQGCLRHGSDRPLLLLVGDSQAAHLWPGLATLRDRYDIVQATIVGCRPLLYPQAGKPCEAFYARALGPWLKANRPAGVLLAGRWQAMDMALLRDSLGDPRLRAANPILIGPVPQYGAALPRLLALGMTRGDPTLARRFADREVVQTDRAMRRVAAAAGVPYLSLVDRLCRPDGGCRTWAAPGVPMQFDYGHLTSAGSRVVAASLAPENRAGAAAASMIRADLHRAAGRSGAGALLKQLLRDRTFRPIVTLRLYQAGRGGALLRPLIVVAHRAFCSAAAIDLPLRTAIGPGLAIAHGWGLVVNAGARIGANVTLFHGVTIGQVDRIARDGSRTTATPVIEDEVWIGPGAAVLGGVTIGAGSRILAGAVVTSDVPPRSLVGGNPAEILRGDVAPDVINRAPLPPLGLA